MKKDEERVILIITGRYGQGTVEENKMVSSILGGEKDQERFNVYFNWYNTVHEVGHIVSWLIGNDFSSNGSNPDFLKEEQFANAFAVAFWRRYGDEETFNELRELVPFVVENFERPVAENEDVSDFFSLMEVGEIEPNFNNYGWCQFSLVDQELKKEVDFEKLLIDCGLTFTRAPSLTTLEFESISEKDISKILKAVFVVLAEWGISIPRHIYHALSNNPNHHMVQEYTQAELGIDVSMNAPKILETVVGNELGEISKVTRIW